MRIYSRYILPVFVTITLTVTLASCKKMVSIDEPIDTVTSEKIYSTELQAEGVLVGAYNSLIHGPVTAIGTDPTSAFYKSFGGGLATLAGGFSAGEFTNFSGASDVQMTALVTNKLSILNNEYPTNLWKSAYNVIYIANSVIEGISASTSARLRDSVKVQLMAEAKFLRAFSYFHLTNFFGDVPLALTSDFNKTVNLRKATQRDVYAQIRKDLLEAQKELAADYSVSGGKRVRANKWAATALLAKVYLFTGDNENAAAQATAVINQTTFFEIEQNLNDVFLTGSREAIFQLMPTNQDGRMKNATAEGFSMLPVVPYVSPGSIMLSNELLGAFESGDQRREDWTDSTYNILNNVSAGKSWYPTKYKIGSSNSAVNAPHKEYYMVFRLAEMFLIRAEARANGADGGHVEGIKDLNVIRRRALLGELALNLSADAVKAAVAQERQIELFAEWGNRWLDLKRTGKASALLSVVPHKKPWAGDYQLLYPIPVSEIENNRNLIQNLDY